MAFFLVLNLVHDAWEFFSFACLFMGGAKSSQAQITLSCDFAF